MASSNISTSCNWEVIRNSLGSDHFPTMVSFNEAPSYEEVDSPKWSYKKADWKKFKMNCQEVISKENFLIHPDEEINTVYERFIQALNEAANISIRKRKQEME